MLQTALTRMLQVVLLAAAQALVCNHIHLFGYATPVISVLLLCYIPINASRVSTMLWAFLLGVAIDIMARTPGQSSAALTLAAFVQRPLLESMAPKERSEDFAPSYSSLGVERHMYFLLILTTLHHTAYVALEYMSFYSPKDMLITLASSVAVSMVVMLTVETMRRGTAVRTPMSA